MKKLLLILTAALLLVCLAAPAMATEVTESAPVDDPLAGTWVFKDKLSLPDTGSYLTFDFISRGESFSSIHFEITSSGKSMSYAQGALGSKVFEKVYENDTWLDTEYQTIVVTSKLSEIQNGEAALSWLNYLGKKQGPPPPEYAAVPDAVTGTLPGYLGVMGSILAALFTPTGDLFQLGVIMAVCLIGVVIYGGVRLFRKLSPGV